MGNNFSSKYELFRNVKADDKKGLNRNYGIFLVLRRKTGLNHVKPSVFLCFLYVLQSILLYTNSLKFQGENTVYSLFLEEVFAERKSFSKKLKKSVDIIR